MIGTGRAIPPPDRDDPLAARRGLADIPGEAGSAPSTPPWPATSPRPPVTRGRPGDVSPSPTRGRTPSPTAAPSPGNPNGDANGRPDPRARRQASGRAAATRQPASTTGAPGTYGTWRLQVPTLSEIGPPGPRGLIVDLEPLPVTSCDHRHYATATTPAPASATWWKYATENATIRPAAAPQPAVISSTPLPGGRRRHVPVRCRASLPSSSPPEAAPQLASRAVPARRPHLDHPRPPIHHRTHPYPDLTPGAGGVGAQSRQTCGPRPGPGRRPGPGGGPGSGRCGAAGHGLGRATPSSARRYPRRAAGSTRIPANPLSAPPQAEQSRAMQVALPPGRPWSGRSLH